MLPSTFSPYANSWYAVSWSSDVLAGKSVPVRCVGRDLVVFRGEDGLARVLDAYCPHMGAHLGINGTVVGNTIRCPFHAWRFDGAGQCVDVPYSPKIPPKARVACWPVREVNGAIFVYFHDRGEAPTFDIPQVPEFGAADWHEPRYLNISVGRHDQGKDADVLTPFVSACGFHRTSLVEFEGDGPFARAKLKGSSQIAGVSVAGEATSSLYGAGFVVSHVRHPIDMMVYAFETPIDEERVERRYAVSVRRKIPGFDILRKAVAPWQVRREILIAGSVQDSKARTIRQDPVTDEGPVLRYRRWHAQFYSSPVRPLPADESGEAERVHLPATA